MRGLASRAISRLRSLRRREQRLAQPWSQGAGPRVLFVSGQDGAPQRYRVLNQAEQLAIAGIAHACYDDGERELARHITECDILYLYRARNTPLVQRLIRQARGRGAPVIYDTDDMIWDQRLVEYCELDLRYAPSEVHEFRALFKRTEALMRQANLFVASTAYLAQAIGAHFPSPVYVNPNALSRQAVALSEPLFRSRATDAASGVVTLGYFSGWPKAHEPDLAVALPALVRILTEHSHVRLRIVGYFDVQMLPETVRPRLELVPFVEWEQLFDQLRGVDINLAPIVDNPHRRAKSAVKYLEAALVGTPTVASRLEPYAAIEHGHTGYLADTPDEWYAGIMALVASAEHRKAVGAAAREAVLHHDTTDARAPEFVALLRALTGRAHTSVTPSRQ